MYIYIYILSVCSTTAVSIAQLVREIVFSRKIGIPQTPFISVKNIRRCKSSRNHVLAAIEDNCSEPLNRSNKKFPERAPTLRS